VHQQTRQQEFEKPDEFGMITDWIESATGWEDADGIRCCSVEPKNERSPEELTSSAEAAPTTAATD
jgi:hypothetical protein